MTEFRTNLGDASWSDLSFEERFKRSIGGLDRPTPGVGLESFRDKLALSDAAVICVALTIGLFVSSRQSAWAIHPTLAIYGTPVAIAALWMSLLFLRGAYDKRVLGLGTEEVHRVISATLYTFAAVAGLSYLVRADISRAYAFVSLPLGLILIVGARFSWRKWLYTRRAMGMFMTPTLLIGTWESIEFLRDKLIENPFVGYIPVGEVYVPGSSNGGDEHWLEQVDSKISLTGARAVAIDPGEGNSAGAVRQLAWRLEGRNIDLLISPGVLDIAGPRLSVRPVADLPLMHLDEVSLTRPQRLSKRCLDLVVASSLLVLLSPLMFTIAIAVRITSTGPAIFRQVRIGRAGRPFTMLKFRTMIKGADSKRESLRSYAASAEPIFKMVGDPRITKLGKWLRRWSLDELPQLLNVLGGSMSLVGPRPHPADDVERYDIAAYRRLALKPGMTGLWQVEGRSEIDWPTALQLDLRYVERWSLATDLVLLARTIRAVTQGRGAH